MGAWRERRYVFSVPEERTCSGVDPALKRRERRHYIRWERRQDAGGPGASWRRSPEACDRMQQDQDCSIENIALKRSNSHEKFRAFHPDYTVH